MTQQVAGATAAAAASTASAASFAGNGFDDDALPSMSAQAAPSHIRRCVCVAYYTDMHSMENKNICTESVEPGSQSVSHSVICMCIMCCVRSARTQFVCVCRLHGSTHVLSTCVRMRDENQLIKKCVRNVLKVVVWCSVRRAMRRQEGGKFVLSARILLAVDVVAAALFHGFVNQFHNTITRNTPPHTHTHTIFSSRVFVCQSNLPL